MDGARGVDDPLHGRERHGVHEHASLQRLQIPEALCVLGHLLIGQLAELEAIGHAGAAAGRVQLDVGHALVFLRLGCQEVHAFEAHILGVVLLQVQLHLVHSCFVDVKGVDQSEKVLTS